MKLFFTTLPVNLLACFRGRMIIFHVAAICLTVAIVVSGFDWRYFFSMRANAPPLAVARNAKTSKRRLVGITAILRDGSADEKRGELTRGIKFGVRIRRHVGWLSGAPVEFETAGRDVPLGKKVEASVGVR